MSDINYKILPCGRKIEKKQKNNHGCKLIEINGILRKYIEEKKLRFTEQRWKLIQNLVSLGGHQSATELVEKLQKKDSRVASATVYRNIKLLCDAGILEESFHLQSGVAVYELSHESHDHIECLDCGEVFEFQNSKIDQIQEKLCHSRDFGIIQSRQIIRAHCQLNKV